MYRGIDDFLRDWESESAFTQKVLDRLTDDSLSVAPAAGARALGTVAWHLPVTVGEMLGKVGLKPEAPEEDAPVPATAERIAKEYARAAASAARQIKAQWNDAMLSNEVELYGSKWTLGGVLVSLVKHQIHHRGQLTALMRHAGLEVPGVYGPAREEWKAMGREPLP